MKIQDGKEKILNILSGLSGKSARKTFLNLQIFEYLFGLLFDIMTTKCAGKVKIMKLDLVKYGELARQAVAEGCVLVENKRDALPLRKGDKVAVFGRCATYYYKSGLGSGGLVNTRYVVSILDALKACEDITVCEELLAIYEKWTKNHPIDEGHGWGTVPWSQAEMTVSEETFGVCKDATVGLVIIGRTAGEDQDNSDTPGSYQLTDVEKDMIKKVCTHFERSVVLLNVGNIVDMSFVSECNPAAVLYVWQGGQEGGNGVVDVLTGKVAPCGKLTDTIAYRLSDYPSSPYFGNEKQNIYAEDIYVGYRYFQKYPEKVQYPFGYGLSYTEFAWKANLIRVDAEELELSVEVTNIGTHAGKDVVQVYVEPSKGALDKPMVLAGFAKTKRLEPGETQILTVICKKRDFASFDVKNHRWMLEEGIYKVLLAKNSRDIVETYTYQQEEKVYEVLEEACAPVTAFERMKWDGDKFVFEPVPTRTVSIKERMEGWREAELPYKGNQGYLLRDVVEEKITLDEFVTQLSDEDLICLFHGEGMCSPKVTAGTAGAFGGLTPALRALGVPAGCCADGPSGIRMDCGTKAFSLPNGTALGCTFNLSLIEELFECLGQELVKNKIDTILGPGINIHRHPLNGRNFEYVSEDPLLTGRVCVAELHGMHKYGVTGTIKHFIGNEQEMHRSKVDAVISERAVREIYGRPFEMAVKEANARAVMTSYNPVNGIWAAGNYELCTTLLRKQWGFEGFVMTDWWAAANWEGEAESRENRAPIVIAQNDVYMCTVDAIEDIKVDNVKTMLEQGVVTRSDLQRNAKNILRFLMQSPAMQREMFGEPEVDADDEDDSMDLNNLQFFHLDEVDEITLTGQELDLDADDILCGIITKNMTCYDLEVFASSDLNDLAQLPVTLHVDNILRGTVSFQGMNGGSDTRVIDMGNAPGVTHYVKLHNPGKGLKISKLTIRARK